MTPVRLLLLALVVTGLLLPPAATSLPSGAGAAAAPADVARAHAAHDSDDEHERVSLVALCACCAGEPETAAPRSALTLPLPSESHDLAAARVPFTEEHVRLPFRPPIA